MQILNVNVPSPPYTSPRAHNINILCMNDVIYDVTVLWDSGECQDITYVAEAIS